MGERVDGKSWRRRGHQQLLYGADKFQTAVGVTLGVRPELQYLSALRPPAYLPASREASSDNRSLNVLFCAAVLSLNCCKKDTSQLPLTNNFIHIFISGFWNLKKNL